MAPKKKAKNAPIEAKPIKEAPLVLSAQVVNSLAETEGRFDSPIDVSLGILKEVYLPKIAWYNMDEEPTLLKITNSGKTAVISAKWFGPRPYIADGPLIGTYVFAQLHFHWGMTDNEGSEHTIDGVALPLEMHVMFFKSLYLTQEEAMKKSDGVIVLTYFFKLQPMDNDNFNMIADALPLIEVPYKSEHLSQVPLIALVNPFEDDYFVYWGGVRSSPGSEDECKHPVLWLLSRQPYPISSRQLDYFRRLLDLNNQPIKHNFRTTQCLSGRTVFHVNPSQEKEQVLHMLLYEKLLLESAKKAEKEKVRGKAGKRQKMGVHYMMNNGFVSPTEIRLKDFNYLTSVHNMALDNRIASSSADDSETDEKSRSRGQPKRRNIAPAPATQPPGNRVLDEIMRLVENCDETDQATLDDLQNQLASALVKIEAKIIRTAHGKQATSKEVKTSDDNANHQRVKTKLSHMVPLSETGYDSGDRLELRRSLNTKNDDRQQTEHEDHGKPRKRSEEKNCKQAMKTSVTANKGRNILAEPLRENNSATTWGCPSSREKGEKTGKKCETAEQKVGHKQDNYKQIIVNCNPMSAEGKPAIQNEIPRPDIELKLWGIELPTTDKCNIEDCDVITFDGIMKQTNDVEESPCQLTDNLGHIENNSEEHKALETDISNNELPTENDAGQCKALVTFCSNSIIQLVTQSSFGLKCEYYSQVSSSPNTVECEPSNSSDDCNSISLVVDSVRDMDECIDNSCAEIGDKELIDKDGDSTDNTVNIEENINTTLKDKKIDENQRVDCIDEEIYKDVYVTGGSRMTMSGCAGDTGENMSVANHEERPRMYTEETSSTYSESNGTEAGRVNAENLRPLTSVDSKTRTRVFGTLNEEVLNLLENHLKAKCRRSVDLEGQGDSKGDMQNSVDSLKNTSKPEPDSLNSRQMKTRQTVLKVPTSPKPKTPISMAQSASIVSTRPFKANTPTPITPKSTAVISRTPRPGTPIPRSSIPATPTRKPSKPSTPTPKTPIKSAITPGRITADQPRRRTDSTKQPQTAKRMWRY